MRVTWDPGGLGRIVAVSPMSVSQPGALSLWGGGVRPSLTTLLSAAPRSCALTEDLGVATPRTSRKADLPARTGQAPGERTVWPRREASADSPRVGTARRVCVANPHTEAGGPDLYWGLPSRRMGPLSGPHPQIARPHPGSPCRPGGSGSVLHMVHLGSPEDILGTRAPPLWLQTPRLSPGRALRGRPSHGPAGRPGCEIQMRWAHGTPHPPAGPVRWTTGRPAYLPRGAVSPALGRGAEGTREKPT